MAKKRIFISCGQRTAEEKLFGQKIQTLINQYMEGFFAEYAHDAADLNTAVFRELQNCDGFVAVMQKRGAVQDLNSPVHYRASVWIQQEIAILHYRSFLIGKTIPMRLYLEMGILPEGLTKYSMINPIPFKETQTILEDLGEWLHGPTFREPPELARREDLFRRRVEANDEDAWLILELIAAHCQGPNDTVENVFVLGDFVTIGKEKGTSDADVAQRFNSKLSRLISSGLVGRRSGREPLTAGLYIEKQWWDLILEELRNQARIKKTN